DDYSWRQASIDATIGAGFSLAGSAFSGALNRYTKSQERGTIADAGAATTAKAEFYFAEVPGHRPEATVADLARLDAEAADLLASGKEPVLLRAAFIRGRMMRTEDGRVGRVVDSIQSAKDADGTTTRPHQVILEIDGKREAHGPDSLSLNRTEVPAIDSTVRLEDGTLGKVSRIEGEWLMVKGVADGAEHRVPAWLIDQKAGRASVLKGEAAIFNDGRAVLAFLKSRDKSTVAHELFHPFRRWFREVDGDGADRLNEQFGETGDQWAVANDERAARLWERYLADGKAPTASLQRVFDQFKQWLKDLWASLQGEAPEQVTPELAAIFDRMLGGGDQPSGGAPDRAGPNFKRVRDQAIRVLGKEGKHSDESGAFMALATAYGQSWARSTGKSLDDFFRERLVGVQGEAIAPDLFARRIIGPMRRVLITPDRRFDWIQRVIDGTLPETQLNRGQWAELRARGVQTPGMKAWAAERVRRRSYVDKPVGELVDRLIATLEDEQAFRLRDANIDRALAIKPTEIERHGWQIAANRIQVDDPNALVRPLEKQEFEAIIAELSLARLRTDNGVVSVVEGMNGQARLVDGRLQISPAIAALPAARRLRLVRDAIMAREVVVILGEEAQAGRPVPRPTPQQVAAWMDRNGLMPIEHARGIAVAVVRTAERMRDPNAAADTLLGGMKDDPPPSPDAGGNGPTADLPPTPPQSPILELEQGTGPLRVVEYRIQQIADELGLTMETRAEAPDFGANATFSGKLPQWVRDAIQGDPSLRSVFNVAKKGERAGGEDMVVELGGEEAYLQWLKSSLKTTTHRALEAASGQIPEIDFLAAVRNALLARRSASTRLKAQYVHLSELPDGAEFTIGGKHAKVQYATTQR
ncbi:MAG TPA: hypothetical protein VEB22_13120, partial [Phycisphaerales bacterium]|nr:hypothetical protein [Phycisphaerales bacterium]